MSLETQIANLVAATNQLTGEVSGKMAGINAAVAQAVAAIPNLYRIVHVDAVVGSDTNNGAAESPVRTVNAAAALIPVGGMGEIMLARDQDHVMLAQAHDRKTIVIYAGTEEPNSANFDIPSGTAPRLIVSGYQHLRSSQIMIGGYAHGVSVVSSGGAFLSDFGVLGMSSPGSSVNITHSIVAISNLIPLINAEAPYMVDLRVRYSRIDRPVAAPLVNISGGNCSVEMDSAILPSGVTMADLITGIIRDANGTPRNLLANFVI